MYKIFWLFSSLNSLGSRKNKHSSFGAFAALVYGLISIGGYVGDHLLGTKRTMAGAVVLAAGYFATGLSTVPTEPDFLCFRYYCCGEWFIQGQPSQLII